MGLKCSVLGHAYEPAGVDREREERGSEVVTVVRELERCGRCDAERVVSESTEVTAVIDEADVDLDAGDAAEGPSSSSGIGGALERSGAGDADDPSGSSEETGAAADAAAAVDELAESPDPPIDGDIDPEDPENDDAEILTDEEPPREPGQWPDDADDADASADDGTDAPGSPDGRKADVTDRSTTVAEASTDPEADDDEPTAESLSGITVPEGQIVCPDCDFEIEAQSGYREGDPCPNCGQWLAAERNP